MSRIDDLIRQHCPDGVKFVPLEDVVLKTANIRWNKNSNQEFRYIDLTSVDRITHAIIDTATITAETAPNRAQQIVHEGDVIFGTTRPMLKRYAIIPSNFDRQICSTGFCVLRPNRSLVLTNFLYHMLGSQDFYKYVENNERGASYPAIPDNLVKKFLIPIPPLPVQQAIVDILDAFTKLEAELEAELEARRQQYAYYRKELLSFDEADARWMTLEEAAASISAGGDLPEKYLKGQTSPTDEFPYPIYSNGIDEKSVYGYTNDYRVDNEAVTISARGTIGWHTIRQAKFTPIVRLIVLIPNKDIISSKFLNYILDITEIGHSGGSIPQLTVPNVKKIKIPVPSPVEQERIVAILDKFDALVNDISSDLPAEIAARRQQYEHYRNQLLTFKEATFDICQESEGSCNCTSKNQRLFD